VQAVSYEQSIEQLEFYSFHSFHKIAISYGANWYQNFDYYESDRETIDLRKMYGRISFIKKLLSKHNYLFTSGIKLHLLGCQCPQEFGDYTSDEKQYIHTIDTSNPIMAAIEGKQYDPAWGLIEKPLRNLNNSMEIDISEINLDILDNNVSLFKKWVKNE